MTRNSGRRFKRSTGHDHLIFSTLFSFFLFVSLLVFPFHEGHCAQVSLAWDYDSISNLAGYKIYYGTTSGNYQWNVDVGNVTSYTLSNLTIGATYYTAATAYTTDGLESTYSNEVMFTVPSCTYSISPSSASFASAGGTGSVSITTQSYCNWTTSSSTPWITVISGSGQGSGTLSYSVSSNPGTTIRTASLTIAGNVFTVTEAGQGQTVYTISRYGRVHFAFWAGCRPDRGRPDLHNHPQRRLRGCEREGGWGITRADYFLYILQCKSQSHHKCVVHGHEC
jgi:hypothetical protein